MSSPQLASKNNYEVVKTLGKGAYGVVNLIQVKEDKEYYALKEVCVQEENIQEEVALLRATKAEYELLKKKIPNILKSFGSHYDKEEKKFMFSTELMKMDLAQLMRKKWEENGYLSFDCFKRLFTDILNGKHQHLSYL
jgi:serine/threonine protein kinase